MKVSSFTTGTVHVLRALIPAMDFSFASMICFATFQSGQSGGRAKCHMNSGHIYSHQTAGMTLTDLAGLCMQENIYVTS